jgi:type IV pilus assembly protein PilW
MQLKSINTKRHEMNHHGFSLIELMVAIAISSIVLAAIYSAYRSQLGTYVTQQTIVDMQQSARSAMYLMQREIRLAGYDPTGNADAGIVVANNNSITFTMDLTEDGDLNDAGEQIVYSLNGDDLRREDVNAGSGPQAAALNIDALNFVYLDANGNNLLDYGLVPPAVPVASLADITAVQITIVARAGENVPVLTPDHTDTRTYHNQQDDVVLNAQHDNFRRLILTAAVTCRNLGL